MKIVHRYILNIAFKNLCLALTILTALFLVFDFFDRIDNILREKTGLVLVIKYFIMKIPGFISISLPISMLVSVIFTIGVLSKNSEITAMRTNGLTVAWLSRPIFILALGLSLVSIFLNETLVPLANRRAKEIYNIDMLQKDAKGSYSKDNFWWREDDQFYSAESFDSRNNSLINISKFYTNNNFQIKRRINAKKASWVNSSLGWTMSKVEDRHYQGLENTATTNLKFLTMPDVKKEPKSFFRFESEPENMSYSELKSYIKEQDKIGIRTRHFLPDLYSKFSFPFIIFIISLISLPFALVPARTGSMAISFLAAIGIGFSYYLIHSFSLAFGRAEFWAPLFSAWGANLLLGSIGVVLLLASESAH